MCKSGAPDRLNGSPGLAEVVQEAKGLGDETEENQNLNLAWVRSKIAKKTGADRSKSGESPIGPTSGPYPVPKRTSTGPWG